MQRGLLIGLLIVVLLVLVPVASGEPTRDVHRYVDLSFTDVSEVEDAIEWRDGYVAATQGGLVAWPGDGPRNVVTTVDGLPSNVVWDVELVGDEVLVATERGTVLVEPTTGEVRSLDVPAHASEAIDGMGQKLTVTEDGDWWILDRRGNLSQRTAGGTWESHPPVPMKRANDLFVEGDRLLAVAEGAIWGPGNDKNWSAYELGEDGWRKTHHTEDAPVKIAVFEGMEVLGLREGGVAAFADGEPVDLGAPEALADVTVLELLPHGDRLWVSTTDGLYVYRASADAWTTYGSEELPSTGVKGVTPLAGSPADPPAMLSTATGLAVPGNEADWTLHTGINGPDENDLLSLESLEGNQVWAGSGEGVNIYFPSVRVWNQWDQSELGLRLASSQVYEIEHRDNMTWFATDFGVYQVDREEQDWRVIREEDPPQQPQANTYYDVTVEGDWLWMPQWGSGLLRHEIGTNNTYKYTMFEGLISHGVLCMDSWEEFVLVCSDRGLQFFDRSKAAPSYPLGVATNRCNNYNCNYTSPQNTTWTVFPDGNRVWAGSAHAGLLTFVEDEEETIAVEHQWTPEDGLPSKEVRAIEPASEGVWVGTTGGLARVTLDGVQETWGPEDGMGTPGVNDIERVGDILYLATLEGLYRLDTDTGELLSMFEGADDLADVPGHVSITFPDQGSSLSAAINVTGSASAPGQPVSEVQVRIDEGEWEAAEGTSEWRYRLPVPELDLGEHEADVRVMANGSDVANTTLTFQVEEAPEQGDEAVGLIHTPPASVTAGRMHILSATVNAPDPWQVEMQAQVGEERFEPRGRTAGDEVTFAVNVPEGAAGSELRYRLLVKSGVGERSFPAEGYYNATIERHHDRGLVLEAEDERLQAEPGETVSFEATLHNTGTLVETITAETEGLRSGWVSMAPEGEVTLPPDQPLRVEATIEVPDAAQPGATGFTLSAVTEDGEQFDTRAFSVHVIETSTESAGDVDTLPTPGLTAPLAALAAALATLATRRGGDRR